MESPRRVIYLGSEAVALGLADAEGGRSDGIAAAAELAGLRDFAVVDLLERQAADGAVFQPDYRSAVKRMVETAPPDAVFLIDSRIPLPGLQENTEVERHLLHLRAISPASLDSVPMRDEPMQNGSTDGSPGAGNVAAPGAGATPTGNGEGS